MKTFILALILIFYMSSIYAQDSKPGDFPEGWKIIKENGKLGFIDNEGVEIVKPGYTHIGPIGVFHKNWMRVSITEGNRTKFGFIDRDGVEVVPLKYTTIGKFGEYKPDWMLVSITEGNRTKFGFIDRDGVEIVEPKYDSIDDIDEI
jgi:hypothetical protein